MKKLSQNFHICLHSGPRGLTSPPPYYQPDRKIYFFDDFPLRSYRPGHVADINHYRHYRRQQTFLSRWTLQHREREIQAYIDQFQRFYCEVTHFLVDFYYSKHLAAERCDLVFECQISNPSGVGVVLRHQHHSSAKLVLQNFRM